MLLFSLPGGGSGIGRAVCQRLASEGASVVVADISEESANETMVGLQNDLRGQGHMAAVVDVSSKESVKNVLLQLLTIRQRPPGPVWRLGDSLCVLIGSSICQSFNTNNSCFQLQMFV
uniref:Hydroxysteroid (17-beta) dehydrogenase 8 n=1 Tax=Labrus bergylta TaxID=56723 RepID=A0A3Q3LSR0_9LABR